jgi:Ser/Thr protein kinase RdoA (MazF antagonist)
MTVPASVLEAFGFVGHRFEPVSGGLINATFAIRGEQGPPVAALQRLHPAFDAEVNVDIDAITSHLAEQGFPTPRLLHTQAGQRFHLDQGHVWRALSWLEGVCYSKGPEPALAREGARLVGRFHRALHGLDYTFVFSRPGVHDTQAHLEKLRLARCSADDPLIADAELLRERIGQKSQELPEMPALPMRICHGDLKISNLLFDETGKGLCLIDLDTMARQTIAYELGDALRSWANPAGEDTSSPTIDAEIVAATAAGYADGSQGLLGAEEIDSVIVGLETICLELAARFCVDIFEDSYFGWDRERFPSRRAHNLKRARGQLALCESVSQNRSELVELWRRAF